MRLRQSYDNSYEVRDVFLDISKSLNKVWHKDVIFKTVFLITV